ncbi:MAG: hypothetical protein U0136_06335 [Bdellovibrionota bacterium]
MKKLLLLALGCVACTPTAPTAAASNPCTYHEEWRSCQSDSDCAVFETMCYTVEAYNKSALDAVRAYNQCMRRRIRCARPSPEEALKTKALCQNQKCVAVNPAQENSESSSLPKGSSR